MKINGKAYTSTPPPKRQALPGRMTTATTAIVDQVRQSDSSDLVIFILSLLCKERRWVGQRGSQMLRAPKADIRSTAAWVNGRPVGVIVRRVHERQTRRTEAGLFLVSNNHRHHEIGLALACIAILQEWQLGNRIFCIINERHAAILKFLAKFGMRTINRWPNCRLASEGAEVELVYPDAAIVAARELERLEQSGGIAFGHPLMQRTNLRAWVHSLASMQLPTERD